MKTAHTLHPAHLAGRRLPLGLHRLKLEHDGAEVVVGAPAEGVSSLLNAGQDLAGQSALFCKPYHGVHSLGWLQNLTEVSLPCPPRVSLMVWFSSSSLTTLVPAQQACGVRPQVWHCLRVNKETGGLPMSLRKAGETSRMATKKLTPCRSSPGPTCCHSVHLQRDTPPGMHCRQQRRRQQRGLPPPHTHTASAAARTLW